MERSDLKTARQAEMLFNRLTKRHKHLKKWASRSGVNAFRLYDRDIPEIPLQIDLYNDAVCGALFERPYEKDDGEEALWLD
ncbi:MAG: rRNA (guanine-N2)-methyltransferase, partial [Treponema sp.]|nr:rRNA (guanine-N2)-methyltransferase [Treponema sp.]